MLNMLYNLSRTYKKQPPKEVYTAKENLMRGLKPTVFILI
jgi:hypothetical protein